MRRPDLRRLRAGTRQELVALMADDRIAPLLAELRAHHWESFAHCLRVGLLCLDVAGDLYAAREEREALGRAGLLHDVGKLAVDSELLRKPTRLAPAERDSVRDHARLGFEALHRLDHEPTRLAVLAHHRFGPDPYPVGPCEHEDAGADARFSETDCRLAREMAQVVAVADVLDALSQPRAYKQALGDEEIAVAFGREFLGDPAYVDLVLRGR